MLAQVHKAVAAVAEDDDLDMDPAVAACVQRGLAGPHLVPPQEPATRPPLTVAAFGMHLHAATTVVFQKAMYSVPWRFIGKQVTVRACRD